MVILEKDDEMLVCALTTNKGNLNQTNDAVRSPQENTIHLNIWQETIES